MSRPTMDRAVEAIRAGDLTRAERLCDDMRRESGMLHDLMVELVAGLITFIQERDGEEAIEDAWRTTMERSWRNRARKSLEADRRRMVELLAATWRAHSTSGRGPHPASFTIEEDDVKLTFRMNPCGSGQRLWRMGRYEGDGAYGKTRAAHEWSYGRENFPLYCTHCTFMNELLPIEWYGLPLYPSDPPADFDRDPCVWYWYKDPADVPERHWRRYGR